LREQPEKAEIFIVNAEPIEVERGLQKKDIRSQNLSIEVDGAGEVPQQCY
jgi:hypothetical protein